LIRMRTTGESYDRGVEYYRRGAVLSVVERAGQIEASVSGSQYVPYKVRVRIGERGVLEASCSCPYVWGGWCKHIVAVLLYCLHEPEKIETRTSIEEILAKLGQSELLDLLLWLLKRRPELSDEVEMRLQTTVVEFGQESNLEGKDDKSRHPASSTTGLRRVDPEPFRRRMRYALLELARSSRGRFDYWGPEDAVHEPLCVVDEVRKFIRDGDGCSALEVLEAVTEECFAEDVLLAVVYADTANLLYELGSAWTEAILTADLSREEREAWLDRLMQWSSYLDEYGLEEAFELAIEAAQEGWEEPELVRLLEDDTQVPRPESTKAWDPRLIEVRLEVLERKERYEEYLRLARATGRTDAYATMLVQIGRVRDAVDFATQHFSTARECLALVEALWSAGHSEEAFQIAEHGLELEGPRHRLGDWLSEAAAAAGNENLALEAARAAFLDSPTLERYLRVRELAAERWPELQPLLLKEVARSSDRYERLRIYLHEGMLEQAIATVDESGLAWEDGTLARVVDAAIESHPGWVIGRCKQVAESIMNEGRSKEYGRAVRWLEKAKRAYLVSGRETEWRSYLAALLERHRRKYTLVPRLKELR